MSVDWPWSQVTAQVSPVAVVVQVPDTPPLPLAVAPYLSAVEHETVEVLAPEVVAAAVAVAEAVEAVAEAVAEPVVPEVDLVVDPDADPVELDTDEEVPGLLVVETPLLVLVTLAVLLPTPEVLLAVTVPVPVVEKTVVYDPVG